MTLSRRDISEALTAAGLAPRRDLGQNFVADPNTVRRIARLATVGPTDHVVEVGAGLGSLTLALADTGAEVLAIEVDHRLVPLLSATVAERANVTVLQADAMRIDWDAVLDSAASASGQPWTLVANLPYNVATPLICDLLDTVPRIRRMIVMVQREVAERLAAQPGSAAYGAVSVKVAYWAVARIRATVPATVFVPRPNVESAVIEIVRRDVAGVDGGDDVDAAKLFALVRMGFAQRRKMLRRSLAGVVTEEMFAAAGVAPEARPQELSVRQWAALTTAVHR